MNIWRKKEDIKNSMILGHRGAMGLAPENTMISFETALSYKADLIELDIHLSKDNQIIVIHDETLERTTTGIGNIQDHNLKELREFDAGIKFSEQFKGERIPVLDEVLDFIKDKEIRLNIEIKNGPVFYKGIEEKTAVLIDKYDYYEKVIVSSFDHNSLKRIKLINPKIHTAILYGCEIVDFDEYVKKLQVSAVHPHHYWVTNELIERMHNLDIAVNTWVINDKVLFNKFSEMGVDSIGTNFPDKMKINNYE